MRKTIGGLVLIAAVTVGSAGIAGAGEYGGQGAPVPGGDTASSVCAFSGRDLPDDIEDNPVGRDDDHLTDGHVQNWGRYARAGVEVPPFLHPGVACRGNAGGEG